MPIRIWKYYKDLSESIGTDEDGNAQGFSVSWFYDMISEKGIYNSLNNLSLAFLGDEGAKQKVSLASESEISQMRQRVRDICSNAPYLAQIDAVANALLNDITIIQGPPGTGKTETIKNILLCAHELDPESKVAVISANSEAISNAVDAVKSDNVIKNLFIRLGNKSIRKEYKEKCKTEDPQLYRQLKDCNEKNNRLFPRTILDRYPIVFSTIHSLKKCVDIEEYDYVIVDECSQVPSYIGMLAISSAKHLVLLGDDEQLPPIHKDRENDDIENVTEIRDETPWYLDEGDNSFMKASKESFGEKCRSILLNEHYRCHPAIIEFCNRYVYENKLVTKTTDDGNLPIRIRWYEGDYWEIIKPNKKAKAQSVNKMQIEVFVVDELPDILSRLEANPEYSICVLSPYRYQLDLLKERLDEVLSSDGFVIENRVEDEKQGVNDVPQLTIHKAQGRGYDRVYILPVEDAGKNPWSQKKELINVAVSRAKKELCVITSSTWMSEELQTKLTGNYVDNSGIEDQCYIKDLLEYVEQEQNNRIVADGYGFVKTSIDSIFAKVPFYRDKYRCPDEKRKPEGNKTSAPEYCMKEALDDCDEIKNEYDIFREVPLKAIEGIISDDEEVNQYIENGARFDFVLAKNDMIYAIMEVDGAYHRSDPETMHKDELKNRAVKSLSEEFYNERFIRIPTDGTTKKEVLRICDQIFDNASSTIGLNMNERMCNQMIEYFDNKMRECADIVSEHIVNGQLDDTVKEALRIDYQTPNVGVFHYDDPLYNAVYLIRYGYAYAYEYSVLYQILLDDYDGDLFGVTSFGCGSCLDAWSLAYARERSEKDISLRYVGTDLNEWGIRFIPENKNAMEAAYTHGNGNIGMRYPGYPVEFFTGDIIDIFRYKTWQYSYNAILFPKILNELYEDNPQYLEDLINCISDNKDKFNADRNHYICISHSKTSYDRYPEIRKIANRICDAINYDGRFNVIDILPRNWNGLGNGKMLVDEDTNENYACFSFPKDTDTNYYDKVEDLNNDFEAINEVENIRGIFNAFLESENRHKCVNRTSTSLFQIVKLVPNRNPGGE